MPTRKDLPAERLVEFGGRVRRSRERRGWTQETLAEAANLHRTYIGQVERGARNLSLANVYALADALEVSIKRLLPE